MPYKDPAKQKEHRRQYYLAHCEEIKAKRKKYVKENPEKIKAGLKAWHAKHPEWERARSKRRRHDPKYKAWRTQYDILNADKRRAYHREYDCKWRKENCEHLRALNKKYRTQNPERYAAANKRWRQRHPEKHVARQLRYARRNPDKIKAKVDRWRKTPRYQQYLDRHAAQLRKKYKENPTKAYDKACLRRARKVAAPGHWTQSEWLVLKASFGNKCLACGKSEQELLLLGRKLVPDHIQALAKTGPNYLSNLQPLCHGRGGCNNRKGTKYIDYRGNK